MGYVKNEHNLLSFVYTAMLNIFSENKQLTYIIDSVNLYFHPKLNKQYIVYFSDFN